MPNPSPVTADSSPQTLCGKRLLAARLRKGWNQSILAEKSGVSRTTLFQMERGAIPSPRALTLNRLAAALDIPVSWLNPNDETLSEPAVVAPNPVRSSAEFDRQTNPYVDVVRQQYPNVFADFTNDDWDELYSCFGTGGALTEDGVLQAALVISSKRETLRRVSLLLETHLAQPTKAMVDSLFSLVEAPASATATRE